MGAVFGRRKRRGDAKSSRIHGLSLDDTGSRLNGNQVRPIRPASPPWEPGSGGSVQQVFVKNLVGRSIAIDCDLEEDVSDLVAQLTARGALPKTPLRITFGSRVLERGVPLWQYGVKKGSNLQTHVCVGRSAAKPQTRTWWGSAVAFLRAGYRRCWGNVRDGHRAAPKPFLPDDGGAKSPDELLHQSDKETCVEIAVTMVTPFAEIEGTLHFPDRFWQQCNLSTIVFKNMVRVTDMQGIYTAIDETHIWKLRLADVRPFLGAPPVTDVWKRFRTAALRVELSAPRDSPLHQVRPLVNQDDELDLGSFPKQRANELHIAISLLKDTELAVDDLTVRFREPVAPDGAVAPVCCVCLEPMLCGQMCRRLACLHSLHAGCAMTLLPACPACPVCRRSIMPPYTTAPEALEVAPQPLPGSSAHGVVPTNR